jgi:hypothetical protein
VVILESCTSLSIGMFEVTSSVTLIGVVFERAHLLVVLAISGVVAVKCI